MLISVRIESGWSSSTLIDDIIKLMFRHVIICLTVSLEFSLLSAFLNLAKNIMNLLLAFVYCTSDFTLLRLSCFCARLFWASFSASFASSTLFCFGFTIYIQNKTQGVSFVVVRSYGGALDNYISE
mgnify:CR=1 FL=1